MARPAVFPVVATASQSQTATEAKARGYTQGHAAGYATGLQVASLDAARALARQDAEHAARMNELDARYGAEIAALQRAAAALAQRTAPVLADAEQALFRCALDLAEALLGQELRDGEASARAALARACGQGGAEVPVAIRMNPTDVALIRAGGHELPEALALVEDLTLNRGDAVAEYPHGFLDARLGAATARARTVLLGETTSGIVSGHEAEPATPTSLADASEARP